MSSVLPPLRGRPIDLTSTFAAFRLDPGTELPPYRNRELMLLIGSGVLATAALAALTISRSGTVKPTVFTYGLLFSLLWVLAHLAVRRFAPAADPIILPVAAALNGIGLVVIYRIDLYEQDLNRQKKIAPPPSLAEKQLVWTLIALVVFVLVLAMIRDHKALAGYTYTAGLVGLVCLMLPVLPVIGLPINGSRIWIKLGPITFQPSEVAKIILLVFFAGYLVEKREVLSVVSRSFLGLRLPRARDLGPVLLAWLASLLVLVFESDLGSSLLFFGMFLVVLYVATERVEWVVIGVTLFLLGAFTAYKTVGHVRPRVDAWLHAFDGNNPTHGAYQLTQSLYDFGAGGITGTGLGQGTSRLWQFPAAYSDFIMSEIGMELGLTGVMAVLVLYGIVVMRGMRAAISAKDAFGKLLATGLAASIALQVFVQVGGVTRLIPLTGLTLPFVSAGGSSIVANAAIIALLLRISDAYRRPAPMPATGPLFDPNAVAESPTTVVQTG